MYAAAIALLLSGGATAATGTSAEARQAHLQTIKASGSTQQERREKTCRYRHHEGGPAFSNREIRLTIVCAAERWGVDVTKAVAVASCESGLNEYARNPYSSASGVWQFISSTWSSVKDRFAEFRRRWELRASVFNGRANAILGVRVAVGGWGPWEGGVCA